MREFATAINLIFDLTMLVDINKYVREGQGEQLEFNKGFNNNTIISVVAIANRNGGKVLIGVSGLGEAKGVQLNKETIKSWINEISQATEPKLAVAVHAQRVEYGYVVIIDVPSPKIKPISAYGKYYLRSGSNNLPLSAHKITEMYLGSHGLNLEAVIASKNR